MQSIRITADHGEWKAGQVVVVSEREAKQAIKEGWGEPEERYEKAVGATRETR